MNLLSARGLSKHFDGVVAADTLGVPAGVGTDAPGSGPAAIAKPARATTNVVTPAVAMTVRMTCADHGPAPNLGDMGLNLHTQP